MDTVGALRQSSTAVAFGCALMLRYVYTYTTSITSLPVPNVDTHTVKWINNDSPFTEVFPNVLIFCDYVTNDQELSSFKSYTFLTVSVARGPLLHLRG